MDYEQRLQEYYEDDVLNGIYESYNSGKDVLVAYPQGEFREEQERFIERYCEENDLEWVHSVDVIVDYDCGVVYDYEDIIEYNGEILGRKSFEDEMLSFEDIKEKYINAKDQILPKWFKSEWIEEAGFSKGSCEFNSGMYEHNDNHDPEEIIKWFNEDGKDIVFQVDYINPFEIEWCVWHREQEA